MLVRLAGVVILAGGISGGMLLAAPIFGAVVGWGVAIAVVLLAVGGSTALLVDRVLARRNEATRDAMAAYLQRDLIAARLAVLRMEARQGTGREITAHYYRVER